MPLYEAIMRFRPCIDLRNGCVTQIVGSTLAGDGGRDPLVNFTSAQPSSFYADMYRRDGLAGGHVIMLGPGNEAAAVAALAAYPGGLQIGGGITPENAQDWLARGAAAVIVTSYVFRDGQVREDRLRAMVAAVGREHLVLDLSCRHRGERYYVVTDRWQNFTEVAISPETLDYFAGFCAEFLVHGVDVEGKCAGIADDLVVALGQWSSLPTTYAGGVRSMADLLRVKELGQGRLDATIGSALDIFGGSGITYDEAVAFNRREVA
jgi:phosphoribosylformimino-5-aminoimidazole carboxamide ribotide isomerase